MWTSIECVGHPRDMGLAQGAALGPAIRASCAAEGFPARRSRWPSLRPWAGGPERGRGPSQALLRHFSHQAERLDGMARAAGVSFDALLALHGRLAGGGPTIAASPAARRAVLQARAMREAGQAKRTWLERTLPAGTGGEPGWILRESRPVVGFRSVEVGLPWLVTAVAGVNEAGLAVLSGPIASETVASAALAPPILLAQECLQRFADLEGALDWCRKRPVRGDQTFVLAEASGQVATVRIVGEEREVQVGCGELLLEAGEPSSEAVSAEEVPRLRLDPAGRRLRLEAPGARLEISVRAPQEDPRAEAASDAAQGEGAA